MLWNKPPSAHARRIVSFCPKKSVTLMLLTCSRWREPVRIFIAIAAAWLAASFAARAEVTYTITSYPAGLADLPCDAFKKNPDWVMDASRHSRCRGCPYCWPSFQEYERDAHHREQVRQEIGRSGNGLAVRQQGIRGPGQSCCSYPRLALVRANGRAHFVSGQ
jgi:hypothetical protein